MKELQFYITSLIVMIVRFILPYTPNALAKRLPAFSLVHGGRASSKANIAWRYDAWEGFGGIKRRVAKIRVTQITTCEMRLFGCTVQFDVRARYLVHLEEGMSSCEIHGAIQEVFMQVFFKDTYSAQDASRDFNEVVESVRQWLDHRTHTMTSGSMSLKSSGKNQSVLA